MSKTVLFEEVSKLANRDDVYLIEIREQSEINETGLIPGSIHIPMSCVENEITKNSPEDFKSKYSRTLPNFDSSIVFTCRSGRRAEIAMNNLESLGYKNCRYYAGSWLEWASKTSSD